MFRDFNNHRTHRVTLLTYQLVRKKNMREIKFRVQSSTRGEWYYFSLSELTRGASVDGSRNNWCQYTGLKDKNGKEIYEGDIVFTKWEEAEVGRDEGSKSIVFYSLKNGGWSTNKEGYDAEWNYHLVFHCFPKHTEVIGNIYENPELLTT